ncbi:hypothetical protein DSM112329_03155 [Paraconexibacter sp. AEG42_29]|uniref:Membrane transport protein MMPL domain-containing protein n=1 Tax=Paraconexibacter sp. AEG42_29 TaxID=2997339 RepID=A0AAU7AY88_9ACTN
MQRISIWAAGRPRAALGSWLVLVAVLAIYGHDVGRHLQPTSARIDGSTSATAGALTAAHFADSATLPILLTGPSKQVRSQGKALGTRLDKLEGVSVLSPWNDRVHLKLLRPRADQVLILASVAGAERDQQRVSELVRTTAQQNVSGPVDVHVTGVPLVARDLRTASIDAAGKADLIALPLLLIVLLLVFRSFAAAAIPVAFGGATVLASGGVIRLLTEMTTVDAFATGLASMMGLALAVDYSLLIVSRYRDERRRGADNDTAIAVATRTSAHAVAVAGAAVVVAMGLAAALAAGQAVASAALGVACAGLLAMAGAALALPAVLRLAGDRLAVPVAAGVQAQDDADADAHRPSRAPVLVAAVLRRPALAATVTAVGLLVLAIPALSPDPSAPDVAQLPESSPARADYEAISAAVGPGWGAGFDIVAVAPSGTMTTPKRLAALEKLQRQIERDPDVAVVLGPGQLAKKAAKLRKSGRDLLKTQKALEAAIPKQQGQIKKLGSQVGSATGGAKQLSGAFDSASTSADKLSSGGSNLKSGVGKLSSGLLSATNGAKDLDKTVNSATANTGAIAATVKKSKNDASDLASALSTLGRGSAAIPPAIRKMQDNNAASRDTIKSVISESGGQRSDTLTAINTARQALLTQRQTVGTIAALAALQRARNRLQSDPTTPLTQVADTLDSDARTAGQIAGVLAGIKFGDLAAKARALSAILGAAESQQGNLDKGISQLTGSIGTLRAALERLGGGTETLTGGLKALDEGIASLRGGAKEGKAQTEELAKGLEGAREALSGVQQSGGKGKKDDSSATASGAITSGYFLLAALDAQGVSGARSGLNVESGGQAGHIVVIPKTGPNDPKTRALGDRLASLSKDFAAATKTETAVGGPAQVLADYQQATSDRLLTIVLVLALATALLLAVVLRSLLVAVLGVALGLLAVGATLGIMDKLFTGSDPILGGPGQLDATALTAVFAVMFALATDYQVFVVTRIREEVVAGRSPRDAVAAGLASTARVVTGAALSMVAVFLAFATADVASLKQFGVGLAVAVALDATLIRLVLLPAVLALCGRAAWWPGMNLPPGPTSPDPPRRVREEPAVRVGPRLRPSEG